MEETVKRGRGRPRKERPEVDDTAEKKGRGRPKGSKNKPKPKKQGRPKGRKSGYTVSEKALMQRRENAHVIPAKTEAELAYNARLIEHVMRINEIATRSDKTDILSLKSCFVAYLKLCQEDGFSVSNMAAYSAMGFYNSNAFEAYCKRDDPEKREFYALVKSTCAMFREGLVSDNKINPVIGIFWQRNYDGLRNDTEQVQAADSQDDAEVARGYKEKYKSLIGGGNG